MWGVPQSDHISYYLFINDIVLTLNYSYILLFADDATLLKLSNSHENAILLQNNLDNDNTNNWCNSNELAINLNKRYFIYFFEKHNLI